jgi:hypothetical protein
MNVDKKREFTPYCFGIAYAEANPKARSYSTLEEIASTFYTPNSRSWGFFMEGMEKVRKLADAKQRETVTNE